MKTSVLVAAWLFLSATMALCALSIDIEHNVIFWAWKGFSSLTVGAIATYLAALVAMVVLAPLARINLSIATMWTLLTLLAANGVNGMRAEYAGAPKPRTPSPLLYRATRAAALTLPVALVYARRRRMPRTQPRAA